MMAVLLQKDGQQLVAYLVGPVKPSLLETWKGNGWALAGAKEIPDPFPGVHREVVYSATRSDDPCDYRP